MNLDPSKYLELFSSEAQEHLEGLSALLMRLEKAAADDRPSLLDELFRHAHSLKGTAAMMGFEASADTAHRFEDWLACLKKAAPEEAEGLLKDHVVDDLLMGVDHLSDSVQADLRGQPVPPRPVLFQEITRRLNSAAAQVPQEPPAPAAQSQGSPAPASPGAQVSAETAAGVPRGPRTRLCLTIVPSSPMPAMRAFLAFKKISAAGTVFSSVPPKEELRGGILPNRRLSLETDLDEGELRKILASLSEIETAEITTESLPLPLRTHTSLAMDGARSPAGQEMDASEGLTSGDARTIRVKAELLDTLLDTVGDFIFSVARLREEASAKPLRPGAPTAAKNPLLEGLDALHREARTLHNQVIAARMTPLATITGRIQRAVREVAKATGREVDFRLNGTDIELDHAVLDTLADPLLHLVRNAVDHGIEPPEERAASHKPPTGHLSLSARRETSRVIVEIADDGKGLSAQKLKAAALERGLVTPEQCAAMSEDDAFRLCFLPGLSTSSAVTAVSGRGVGMDIVKSAVESVGGSIEFTVRPGTGTTWQLALPYTVAIAQILIVRVGAECFGIPLSRVAHVTQVPTDALSVVRGQPFLRWQKSDIPVFSLGARLRVDSDGWDPGTPRPLVIAEGLGQSRLAFQVDAFLGQQRSILRPLRPPLDRIPCLSGVTLQTGGRPLFILDVTRLFPAPKPV